MKRPRLFIILFTLVFVFSIFMVIGSGPAENAIQISAEINQALGVQKDAHQYYVAGKNTVIRAFLSRPVIIDEQTTGVSVYKNNQHVFNMLPKPTGRPVSTIDFVCSSLADCQNWAAGSYKFDMSVNGTDYSLTGPYTFASRKTLRVLAVSVKANYNGTVKQNSEGWKKLGMFTQNVYPLADGNFKWSVYPNTVDLSDCNIETDECQDSLDDKLKGLIPAKCMTSPNAAGCYDYVIGMIPTATSKSEGWATPNIPVVIVAAGSKDAAATVAHELAHKHGIGDTYDEQKTSSIRCSVNPAPDGFKGKDWDKGFAEFSGCTAGRPKSTLLDTSGDLINGAMVPASSHPYEWSRGYLGEKADFMSAGGALQSQLWITPDCYDWLFNQFAPGTSAAEAIRSDTPSRFAVFSGRINKDRVTVTLDHWESYEDTATLADTTSGDYVVEAINENISPDTVVASTGFTVQFNRLSTESEHNSVRFEGVINFPTTTTMFRLRNSAGTVLASLPVGSTAPTVSSVTPLSPETINSSYTITWSSTGSDLTYVVSYNPDAANAESPWLVLADDITEQTFTEDFSALPGASGSHAQIKVTASDGVLCGEGVSSYFTVPPKSPEVYIGDLPDSSTYIEDAGITLTAEVIDAQDSTFSESNIKWTSSISGNIGTGSSILIKHLPVGTQTITVTATNSLGLSDTDTVTIEVADDTPGSDNSGGCFIGSALSGSDEKPVTKLINFFNFSLLLKNSAGLTLMKLYSWVCALF